MKEIVSSESELSVMPLSEMTDYIVGFYHDRLRLILPELILLAEKVERVHADHHYCPKGLTQHLHEIHRELLDHMMKEEQILFPLIKNGQGHLAFMPIKVMQAEHEIHDAALKKLRMLTFDFKLPEGACGTWNALYKGLSQLEVELMEHIHLENSNLFVRASKGHGSV